MTYLPDNILEPQGEVTCSSHLGVKRITRKHIQNDPLVALSSDKFHHILGITPPISGKISLLISVKIFHIALEKFVQGQ